MVRKGIRGRIRPALDLPAEGGVRKVYPFPRNWIAIGALAVFDAVFIIPAVTVFNQAADSWLRFEDLFDLVTAIFSSAWLLGWSIGPLVMTIVLVLMLFGRETVRLDGDRFRLFIGLPLVGASAEYQLQSMRNLRVERPEKASGKGWRGTHLAFDYGANTVAFGSDAGETELARMTQAIEQASGRAVRTGEATAEELEGAWPLKKKDASQPLSRQPAEALAPVKWSSPSTVMLILANLIPVAGTVFFGWRLGDVMVLYWAESAVIGFYNLCKLAVIDRWLALFTGTFFIAHFGAFMAVHFLFIWTLFVKGLDYSGGGDLGEVARHFVGLWPALAALLLSHGISFFINFIGRREYLGRSSRDQMSEPYSRIVFMHITLIFGGGLALLLGSPAPVILLVIAVKVVVDVRGHIRERSPNA